MPWDLVLDNWIFFRTPLRRFRLKMIPIDEAVTKFLLDVERGYDRKLGYESKVKSLRDEVDKLNQEQSRLRAELLLLPLIGPKLVKLTQSGVSEQDIINTATVFEKYVAGIDRQSFASELKTYGGLKSAIQKLTKESDRMRLVRYQHRSEI